jgi:hypothetical protein
MPKLAERLAEVALDRMRADKELSGDLSARVFLCRQVGDV